MRKSKFTESQILAILKEGEVGVGLSELTRERRSAVRPTSTGERSTAGERLRAQTDERARCRERSNPINAFAESFIGRLCDECLNNNWFGNLLEARQLIEERKRHCDWELM
jgi:hypothetical protein